MLLALTFVLGCACCMKSKCATKKEKEKGKEIAVSQVPKAAMEAAQNAVKGINLTEAEVEKEKVRTVCTQEGKTTDGKEHQTQVEKEKVQMVYTLEGKTTDGKEYKIEVTADGKVLEVSQEAKDNDKKHEKSKEKE